MTGAVGADGVVTSGPSVALVLNDGASVFFDGGKGDFGDSEGRGGDVLPFPPVFVLLPLPESTSIPLLIPLPMLFIPPFPFPVGLGVVGPLVAFFESGASVVGALDFFFVSGASVVGALDFVFGSKVVGEFVLEPPDIIIIPLPFPPFPVLVGDLVGIVVSLGPGDKLGATVELLGASVSLLSEAVGLAVLVELLFLETDGEADLVVVGDFVFFSSGEAVFVVGAFVFFMSIFLAIIEGAGEGTSSMLVGAWVFAVLLPLLPPFPLLSPIPCLTVGRALSKLEAAEGPGLRDDEEASVLKAVGDEVGATLPFPAEVFLLFFLRMDEVAATLDDGAGDALTISSFFDWPMFDFRGVPTTCCC